jgi:chromosome partitioning protein
MTARLNATSEARPQVIRLGFQNLHQSRWISELTTVLKERFPHIQIRVERGSLPVLNEKFNSGELDAIFDLRYTDQLPEDACYKAFPLALYAAMNAAHPLAQRKGVYIHELKDEHFVMLREEAAPMIFKRITENCLQNGFSITSAIYYNASEDVTAAVAAGEGITLTDVLTGEGETVYSDNLSETDYPCLHMLPADMRLLTLDLRAFLGGGTDGMDKRLYDFLACAKDDEAYDFCLIDCPPSFTAASVAALVCADEVILPVKADAFSRAGALEMIAQVQSLARWHVAPRFRVLVTMADRTRLSRQVEAQLRDSGLDVFETVIPASVCVGESTFARRPLYEYAPESKAALGYAALLKEVRGDG